MMPIRQLRLPRSLLAAALSGLLFASAVQAQDYAGMQPVDRIAAVIDEQEPDIVCLQELDVGRARTGMVDQARSIADRLEMTSRFHPAMRVEAEYMAKNGITSLGSLMTHLAELTDNINRAIAGTDSVTVAEVLPVVERHLSAIVAPSKAA